MTRTQVLEVQSGHGTITRSAFQKEVEYELKMDRDVFDASTHRTPHGEVFGPVRATISFANFAAKEGDILTISDGRRFKLGPDTGAPSEFNARLLN